ncbi:hypothetical protein [Phytoactinopolyspora mesophila]|nr:hypothetical protein [Phytoactinopolyspora mesophila]
MTNDNRELSVVEALTTVQRTGPCPPGVGATARRVLPVGSI